MIIQDTKKDKDGIENANISQKSDEPFKTGTLNSLNVKINIKKKFGVTKYIYRDNFN